MLVVSGLYSSSIRLPNAQPAKIQTNRKEGFKKSFSASLQSHYFLHLMKNAFVFKTFFMLWLSVKNFAFRYLAFVSSCFFFSWSVGQNAAQLIKLKSELLYGYMACDLRLFALHSSSSTKKTYIKELSIILLTDPSLIWGCDNQFNFNFLL